MDAELRERLISAACDEAVKVGLCWELEPREFARIVDAIFSELEAAGYTLSKRIPVEGKVS